MTSQPPVSSTNPLLALRELGIPGRSPTPIYGDVWGLNIGAVRDTFPRHGLQCLAGPWGNMDVGDLLRIFWGTGSEVLRETVDEEEKGKELTLFVPSERIRDGLHLVSYSVTRLGGVPDPSEVMQVLVKLTRPGGQDENGGPGHSHLHMEIPKEILDGGIDKDNVTVGVPITILPYREMAVGDVIQVSWGGKFVLSEPLTEEQVAGTVPIVVLIDEVTIRAAGDSDRNGLAVVFEVYDLVFNRSEDWSAEQRVVVDTGNSRLAAPFVKNAVKNILDLDKPGDGFTYVQIVAGDDNFKQGDIIILRVRGTPLEGAPVDFEVEWDPLDHDEPGIVERKLFYDQLRPLAKTQVVFDYRLQKADGSPDLRSKGRFVNVIGEIMRLKAPIAVDAQQGAIDPELKHTLIEIPFDSSFAAGQAIKLFWLGTRSDHSPYLPDLGLRPITNGDIEAGKSLFIMVPGEHLKTLKGGFLELYYRLLIEDAVLGTLNRVNATHAIRESEHAPRLNVGQALLELPAPEVAGVVNGVLADPDRPGTTLTVVYLDTEPGDEVICQWIGSKTGRHSDSVKLNSFTAGKPVPFTIKAELIKGNEGGTVTALYSIKPAAGATKYSNELVFSVGVLVTPEITSVKDPQQVEIPPGSATTASSVTLTGTAMANREVEIFNGTTSLGPFPVGANGIWTLTVTGLGVATHSFTAQALYGTKPVSAAWSVNVVAALRPEITSVKDPQQVEISHGGTTTATSVTLTGTATANLQVEIFNGTVLLGPVTVGANGVWTLPVNGLSVATHSFTAKALYGAQPVSPARSLTVNRPLAIYQPQMVLKGFKFIQNYGWATKDEVSGNTETRAPTGGVPPYSYTPQNPAIASVTSSGKVVGLKSGTTNIIVSDASLKSVSYQVVVSNVYRLIKSGSAMTHAEANTWALGQGGSAVDLSPDSNLAGNFSNLAQMFPVEGVGGALWHAPYVGGGMDTFWRRGAYEVVKTGNPISDLPTDRRFAFTLIPV